MTSLWTKAHIITIIPSFIAMLSIAILLSRLFKEETEFIKMLPIRLIAIILIFMEVVKQSLSIYEGYNTYYLPFHFCSMFVFLFPLYAFCRGRFKEHVRICTVVSCTMLFLFMIIFPNSIYSETSINEFFTDFFSFHTVFFHNIVIFGFFYIVASKLYTIDTKRDYKAMFVIFSIYSVIACVVSQVFKVNFNGFYTGKIELLELVRLKVIESLDWVGQLIYVLCVYIAIMIFALLCYWLLRWTMRLIIKIANKLYSK